MGDPILTIKQLGFEVSGKKILHNIDFSVDEGEFITIRGASGSGKSTLLKMIALILSPTSGNLLYQNQSIETYEPTDYRKQVSYCFQTATLFEKTVKDNLAFPFEIRHQEFDLVRAVNALHSVGLTEEYLMKEINILSGGEKQRIALVRNLLFTPKVLLLDEVSSALDIENQRIINHLVREMNQEHNVTILEVTHTPPSEMERAGRVIHIRNGEVEE